MPKNNEVHSADALTNGTSTTEVSTASPLLEMQCICGVHLRLPDNPQACWHCGRSLAEIEEAKEARNVRQLAEFEAYRLRRFAERGLSVPV